MHNTYITIALGDLCDNIGLVGVSAKWSYVTASPSHHDQAIPILSPLHVGHPYIKIPRNFDLLVSPPFLVSFRQVATQICTYNVIMPEAVYCCFTGTTLFTNKLTCRYCRGYRYLSVHKVSSLNSLRFLRYT